MSSPGLEKGRHSFRVGGGDGKASLPDEFSCIRYGPVRPFPCSESGAGSGGSVIAPGRAPPRKGKESRCPHFKIRTFLCQPFQDPAQPGEVERPGRHPGEKKLQKAALPYHFKENPGIPLQAQPNLPPYSFGSALLQGWTCLSAGSG